MLEPKRNTLVLSMHFWIALGPHGGLLAFTVSAAAGARVFSFSTWQDWGGLRPPLARRSLMENNLRAGSPLLFKGLPDALQRK